MSESGKKPGGQYRILIGDESPIYREGLKQAIKRTDHFVVCAEFDRRDRAASLIHLHKPDLVLLELEFQRDIGLEFVKELVANFPGIRILVLSHLEETLYGERVLRAGARGYLMKNCTFDHLYDAMATAIRGEIFTSESFTALLLKRMYLAKPHSDGPSTDPMDKLSDRELEVFALLGTGIRSREVAKRLKLGVKTVETHRENIKRKLGLRDAPSLLQAAVIWLQDRNAQGAKPTKTASTPFPGDRPQIEPRGDGELPKSETH